MEDIVLTIVPVGERSMVGACLLDWLRGSHDFLVRNWHGLALITPEFLFVGRLEFHGVWVDDFGLLLHVESLLVILDICLLQSVCVVLTIVGEESLWVGIADKTIDATGHSGTLVSGRQGFEWRILVDCVYLFHSNFAIFAVKLAEAPDLLLPGGCFQTTSRLGLSVARGLVLSFLKSSRLNRLCTSSHTRLGTLLSHSCLVHRLEGVVEACVVKVRLTIPILPFESSCVHITVSN